MNLFAASEQKVRVAAACTRNPLREIVRSISPPRSGVQRSA
jgi:hypothetical protein